MAGHTKYWPIQPQIVTVIKICNLFVWFWCVGHIYGRKMKNNLWVYIEISLLIYAF